MGTLPTLCFYMLVQNLGSKDTQISLGCLIISMNQFTVGVKNNQKQYNMIILVNINIFFEKNVLSQVSNAFQYFLNLPKFICIYITISVLAPVLQKISFCLQVIPEKSVLPLGNDLNLPLSTNLGFSSLHSISFAQICFSLNDKNIMNCIQFFIIS